MKNYSDVLIPWIGIHLDISPLLHVLRDFLFAFGLWWLGYRDFQLCFTIMIISGFWEAGNGICYGSNGQHGYFDLIDFVPAVFAGPIVIGIKTGNFPVNLFIRMVIIYFVVCLGLWIANKILKRPFVFQKG